MDELLNNGIDERTGWPEELRTLLKRYPRETWRSQRSPMAEFWLERHEHFRHQANAMQQVAEQYRHGQQSAAEFSTWITPRLQFFLSSLHGHHQIEDFHYFPAFRASERELAPGFDVLARDHELIHAAISDIVEKINAFLETVRARESADADSIRFAGDRYCETSERLFRRLLRHLEDEEDLIIPIMLDRG